MADLKGSKTEQNLMAAFAGESQAHTKYLYYASKAKKDGYVQIGSLFEETAKNEKEHAKIWFKLLHGGMPLLQLRTYCGRQASPRNLPRLRASAGIFPSPCGKLLI